MVLDRGDHETDQVACCGIGVLELRGHSLGRSAAGKGRRGIAQQRVASRRGRSRATGSGRPLQVRGRRQARGARHSGFRYGPQRPRSAKRRLGTTRRARACCDLPWERPMPRLPSAPVFSSKSSRATMRPALRSGRTARYVALPDFFADDVVFDPVKLTMSRLTIPAENFLLQFIEGGDAMVMCIWPGNLKLPATRGTAASAPKIAKDGPDPQVDLVFAGQGRSRRVGATRIEFQNKPVYVGILEHKGIWHDEDVRLFRLQAYTDRLETALRGPLARRLHRGRGEEYEGLARPQPILRVSEYQQSESRSLVGTRHGRDGCAFRRRHEQCKPEEVVGARGRKRPADLARVARQLLHLSGRVQRRRGSFVPLCRQGRSQQGAERLRSRHHLSARPEPGYAAHRLHAGGPDGARRWGPAPASTCSILRA